MGSLTIGRRMHDKWQSKSNGLLQLLWNRPLPRIDRWKEILLSDLIDRDAQEPKKKSDQAFLPGFLELLPSILMPVPSKTYL